jgi:hypothetical protein
MKGRGVDWMIGKREVWLQKGRRVAGIEGRRERWRNGRRMTEDIYWNGDRVVSDEGGVWIWRGKNEEWQGAAGKCRNGWRVFVRYSMRQICNYTKNFGLSYTRAYSNYLRVTDTKT